ncbi:MAG: hypothetical protein C0P68_003175 [Bacillota bacterium]|nr:hypothetical protein [Bacillota bacterium]
MTPATGLQWIVRRALRKGLRGREWIIFPLLALYWISPVDLMPFLPMDDLIMTALGILLYRFLRKDPVPPKGRKIIDVEGKVIR